VSSVQQASIDVSDAPAVQYLLRLGDTCLIQAQRLGEWCGHAPVIEEDIALTNMALDLIGQARAVLTRAGELEALHGGVAHDEDQLAFLREERDFRNLTLVELPRGDFAVTVLRNFVLATFLGHLWERLAGSSDAELAAAFGADPVGGPGRGPAQLDRRRAEARGYERPDVVGLDLLVRGAARVGRRQHRDQPPAFGTHVAHEAEVAHRQHGHLGVRHAVEHLPGALDARRNGQGFGALDARGGLGQRAHHTPPGCARCRCCISARR
jgi:hypothetical protein